MKNSLRNGSRAGTILGVLLMVTLLTGAALAEEFRVNSFTSGVQHFPFVSTFSHGGFVVVWTSGQSPGDDSSGRSIVARRFDASASPVGEDFQVNTETSFSQSQGLVEVLANDGFVVVWNIANTPLLDQIGGESLGETGDTRGQVFDSAGNPVSTEFQVNAEGSYVTNYGHEIAAHEDGGFAVVWNDFDDDVFIRSYDSAGNALTEPFLLASGEDCFHTTTIATAAGSVYVPSWSCFGPVDEIHFRRFDSSGVPLGPEQIAPAPGRALRMIGTDDGFLLTYRDGAPEDRFGQLFDSVGQAVGSAFEMGLGINIDSGGAEGFTNVWYDGVPAGTDTDRLSIKRARYSSSGATLADAVQVNVFTTHDQAGPDVAALPDGRFVVVWGSYFSNDEDNFWSIRARIVSDDVFADGFEKGNTDAWTAAVP